MWIVLAFLAGVLLAIIVANLSSSSKKIERKIEHRYGVRDPQFCARWARCWGRRSSPAIGSRRYATATRSSPPCWRRFDSRAKTIRFETFIYWSGSIGREFADALSRASPRGREGPRDARLAGLQSDRRVASIADDGSGRPGAALSPADGTTLCRLNNRTHRKLLIVDGRMGFTGGVGIADEWMGHAEDPYHWRDSHYRLEGPAVAQHPGRVHGQLDGDQRRGAARLGVFPAARARRRPPAQVFTSSRRRRQRERAG